MQSRTSLGCLVLALLAAGVMEARGADEHHPTVASCPGLDAFKALTGDWVAKQVGGDEKEFTVNYKVTAGGSAVVETISPGTDHEMVTVIHGDGPDLVLTHYCMLGNQPQMKAPGDGKSKTVAFKFVRATNLGSDKDMYMHDVTYTFVDKDTLRSEWTHYNDGKPSGNVVFELKRKS
ncbi:MAG TPA: hypothetical protein VHZ24_11805 [Pirellulales bacterium]|jgi:hypothetical protein|nr:hypothetical protein [Pirellulales bacterium]